MINLLAKYSCQIFICLKSNKSVKINQIHRKRGTASTPDCVEPGKWKYANQKTQWIDDPSLKVLKC